MTVTTPAGPMKFVRGVTVGALKGPRHVMMSALHNVGPDELRRVRYRMPAGEVCSSGVCQVECGEGLTECDGPA